MKKGSNTEKIWMTKKDVMRYIQKSRRTIDNWMSNGVIRFHRCGGSILFDQEELDEDIRGRNKKACKIDNQRVLRIFLISRFSI